MTQKDSVAIILVNQKGKLILQHRDNIENIEYPDYWSLFGGWIESNETPEESIMREVKEEICYSNQKELSVGKLNFLYKCIRNDRPWSEYVFLSFINCEHPILYIHEGQAIGEFGIEECLYLIKIAPHHKQHLLYLIENAKQNKKISIITEIINLKNNNIMSKVKDFIELTTLGNVKDYKALEVGDGYILPSENRPVGVIHTKESADIIALLVFAKDTPRGDHYHHDKIEYMTVLSGRLKCEFSLPESPEDTYEIILEEGQQIKIKPGCIHTYTALGKDVYALEYAPNRYKEKDVVMASNSK